MSTRSEDELVTLSWDKAGHASSPVVILNRLFVRTEAGMLVNETEKWWQRFRIVMSSMAKKAATAKASTIDRTAASSPPDLVIYVRDLDQWPRSWMGLEKDVPPGEELVACFRPFLEHLASTSLSRKTIRKHIDNLWVLGGEIIRDLHQDPSLRRKDVAKVLRDVIDDEGGPLIHGGSSEPQQNSFDSTCRRLHRFLSQPPR